MTAVTFFIVLILPFILFSVVSFDEPFLNSFAFVWFIIFTQTQCTTSP